MIINLLCILLDISQTPESNGRGQRIGNKKGRRNQLNKGEFLNFIRINIAP